MSFLWWKGTQRVEQPSPASQPASLRRVLWRVCCGACAHTGTDNHCPPLRFVLLCARVAFRHWRVQSVKMVAQDVSGIEAASMSLMAPDRTPLNDSVRTDSSAHQTSAVLIRVKALTHVHSN
jgi:hypothetical protein